MLITTTITVSASVVTISTIVTNYSYCSSIVINYSYCSSIVSRVDQRTSDQDKGLNYITLSRVNYLGSATGSWSGSDHCPDKTLIDSISV